MERKRELEIKLQEPLKHFTLDPLNNYYNYGKFFVLNTDRINGPDGVVGTPVQNMTTLQVLARADFFAFYVTGIIYDSGGDAILWDIPLYINIFNEYDNNWLGRTWIHWTDFAGNAEYQNWLPIPRGFAAQTILEVHLRSEYTFNADDYVQIAFFGVQRKVK
ncbi:MAG: hypothetical protein ABII90_03630 [Bacteroidota bacterium]